MTGHDMNHLFDRVRPLVSADGLQGKETLVIGLGSGGGKCVEHLAKSGVDQFMFADGETLGIENVCRHVCGIESVGRPKVEAMRDYVLNRNPRAGVTTFQKMVDESQRDWLLHQVQSGTKGRPVSLVICGTDTQRSKHLINSVCVEAAVPAIFAGCFEKACGGEVIRYRPGGACFGCVNSFLRREGLYDTLGKKSFNYSDIHIDDIADSRPEPGLGMDVEFIALIQAKLALLTLLASGNSELADVDGNYILFGNRPVDGLFTNHLQSLIYRVPPQTGCLVCQNGDSADTDDQARRILSNIITWG